MIIGHNWAKRLRGSLCSALSPRRTAFHLFYFRAFPHFSARTAILAGDRELAEAGQSPLGRAGRAERCRFIMGTTIYQCYTYCQEGNIMTDVFLGRNPQVSVRGMGWSVVDGVIDGVKP